MSFPDMIFTRNQSDLSNDTDLAYHNASDLMRLTAACDEIGALFSAAGIDNSLTPIPIWEQSISIDDESSLAVEQALSYTSDNWSKMLQNIAELRSKGFVLPTTPEVPLSFNRPTIEMANDIERILYDIYTVFTEQA